MKRIVSLLLIILLNGQLVGGAMSYGETKLEIGDIVSFGEQTYYILEGGQGEYVTEPLLWEIINFDDEGDPLLFATGIVTYKAFDAAESGRFGKVADNPYTSDDNRSMYGSNRWSNSTLREWLNGGMASQVKYSTQPPSFNAVSNGMSYDNKDGFLYSLVGVNTDKIKSVSHKSRLASLDGVEEDVTDKVFLLSVEELQKYVIDNDLNPMRKPLKRVHETEGTAWLKEKVGSDDFWRYWLRTPDAIDYASNSHANYVVAEYIGNGKVEKHGMLETSEAAISYIGVCPAMYINSNLVDLEIVSKSTRQPKNDVVSLNTSTASQWAVSEIKEAFSRELTTDKVTDNFTENITREEFCEIVMKFYDQLGGKPIADTSNPFSDTANPEVIRAYNAKIVGGTSETTFTPNNNLARQELCVMLIRALNAAGSSYSTNVEYQQSYSDKGDIAGWATDGVRVLNGHKIFNGTGAGLDPKGTVTKEVAIILMKRTFDKFK